MYPPREGCLEAQVRAENLLQKNQSLSILVVKWKNVMHCEMNQCCQIEQ